MAVRTLECFPALYTAGRPPGTRNYGRSKGGESRRGRAASIPSCAALFFPGHLPHASGTVTLRWEAVDRATSYNVRWSLEDCSAVTGTPKNATTITGVTTTGMDVKQAAVTLDLGIRLYHIEVQAVIVEESPGSDFAIVYPTRSAAERRVATMTTYRYQDSGDFTYRLCAPSVATTGMKQPRQVPVAAATILGYAQAWEDAMAWDTGHGTSSRKAARR